jgi:hypothetical protein
MYIMVLSIQPETLIAQAPVVQPIETPAVIPLPVEEPPKPVEQIPVVPEPTTTQAPAETQVEQQKQHEVNVNNVMNNGEAPKEVETVVIKLSLNSINPSTFNTHLIEFDI